MARSYSSWVPSGPSLSAFFSLQDSFSVAPVTEWVSQFIHADCLIAIQATKGLCASKACSVLTDLTRKDFVLLSQHIPIDIIHVSAHQGDSGNEFADLFAIVARTCVASHSPSEWPHRRLDLNLLVSNDLVAEKFWTLVEHSRDPMCSRPCVSPARKLVTIVAANVLTVHPAQVPDSDPSLFSARRLQLSLCFESKLAHLVGVQESRCRETSIWSFRGYTVLSSAATPLGQGGCELWVSSDVAKIKDFCLLHADPRRLMVTLPLHGCTSLATVLHAPDRHHGERRNFRLVARNIGPSQAPLSLWSSCHCHD